MLPYIKLIRFPNLLIVAITQFLLEFIVLIPIFQRVHISPVLDIPHFTLLVISTMLIAAGGYVINDIEDHEIDAINKPEKQIITKQISIKNAWYYYFSLFSFGFAISLYLAFYVHNLPLIVIYPAAWLLLYLYSKYFKKMLLIGNVVVAIFCAFVAGIVWFAERNAFFELNKLSEIEGRNITAVFFTYMFFAFVSTLFREVVKDIEDYEGDEENDCKTIAIVLGKKIAKGIAFLIAFVFIIGLTFLFNLFQINDNLNGQLFLVFAMFLPLIYSLYILIKTEAKKEYHLVSQIAKYLMLSGILLLFFI